MRTEDWYPLSSVLVSPASPGPAESPLSLNIPRPPTLNFPNLKSISVWKSTINFTLTCWTGGKKKIIFNLEIRKIKKCHRRFVGWALIGRHCYYVSCYWSREPGFYWTTTGTENMNRINIVPWSYLAIIFWNRIRELWYVDQTSSTLAAYVKEEFCFTHLFGNGERLSQILTTIFVWIFLRDPVS